VPSNYYEQILPELRTVMENHRYVQAENLFDAAQNPDTMIAVSAALNLFARGLIKIARDLRLLSSGPEAGIGELVLPPMQPGSSIMPGKVNPVIPEFVFQLCIQVCGKHAACEAALDHGELDLNVWESLIVVNILDAMNLLATAVSTLTEKCVQHLTINEDVNRQHTRSIIPLLTQLTKQQGYARINQYCKQADGNLQLLREILMKNGLL
jgi:aspartate ammonia-lyase